MSTVTVTSSKTATPSKPWQTIRDEKRAEQLSRIPEAWRLLASQFPAAGTVDLRPVAETSGILSTTELEITSEKYDATGLAAEISQGKYSAVEVVTAFCKRAAISQQLCNSLTEICFADAIERAKGLDEHFKKTGHTVGPLHGLPMTFKECFHIKGYDACDGYISRCFQPSTITTPLVSLVEKAGAVVIAKTNVPQSMIVAECDNNVFGQTLGPIVSHLTSGGSSGGEGSLSAFRGNTLGIGTDVGGSIRIPAACNGIYGYKPSQGVIPFIGYAASGWTGVNTGIPAVCGPMGRSMRDLILFTETVRSHKPWEFDPAVIEGVMEFPIPPTVQNRKPVVGILHHSGVMPHPPVRRAIRDAQAKLEAAGFETRDFTPTCPNFLDMRQIARQLFTIDGFSYPKKELAKGGEPVVPSVAKLGYWEIPRKTHEEIWAWNTKKGAIQKAMLDAWQNLGIDVLITPVGPHTAVKAGDWTIDLYTVAWNVMDYPAVVIPFGTANPALDPKDDSFVPMNAIDEQRQALYDPDLMAGAPVGIQIVGPRLKDAMLLKHAEVLDNVLNGDS